MNRGNGNKRSRWLVFAGLILCWSSIVSCESIKSVKLENPAQLPPSQDNTQVRTGPHYVLDVGDEVTIKVWGFDDLQKTAYLDNAGEITFPLLGRLKLAGQTVPKAREMLTTGLKKYIVDPQVDFTTSTGRHQVYVFGEVNNPGMYVYRRPLMVLEAIARAGWFNRDANRQTIVLVRQAQGKYHVVSVATGDMFKHGSKIQEVYLQSGDLLYVSPMGIVKLERMLQHLSALAQPFLTLEQAVVLWPQFVDALEGRRAGTGLSISTPTSSSTSSTSTTTTTSSGNSQ